MISDKEYNDFMNNNFEKGVLPINFYEIIQRNQQEIAKLKEEIKELQK